MDRAVFLDRDGVLNEDNGYTYKLSDLRILDGVIDGLKKISNLNYKLIIITNQSGIARGLFSENQMHLFMKGLLRNLSEHDIYFHDYFFCPHHSDGIVAEYAKNCSCRKPEAGMLFHAEKKHDLDLTQSILIGDKETDILAGVKANLRSNILIDPNGKNNNSRASDIVKNLVEASKIIKDYF